MRVSRRRVTVRGTWAAVLLTLGAVLAPFPLSAIVGVTLDCRLVADECRSCPSDVGSGNGSADPGERVTLEWTLQNVGNEDLTGIVALANTAASDLFCPGDLLDFGDLLIGESSPGVASPACVIETTQGCGTMMTLQLDVLTDQGSTTASCTLPVPDFCDTCCGTGLPGLDACLLESDLCPTGGAASGDGAVDPGEILDVTLSLTNQGNQRTGMLRALVSSPTPGVRVLQPETSFDVLRYPETKSGTPAVQIFADGFQPAGGNLALSVTIQEMDPSGGWTTVEQDGCFLAVAAAPTVCLPEQPPGPVEGLRVGREGDRLRLRWTPAPNATRYALHKGDLPSQPAPPWTHQADTSRCLMAPPERTVLAGELDGVARYYLIQSRNALADGEAGTADLDGDGAPETIRDADLSVCP